MKKGIFLIIFFSAFMILFSEPERGCTHKIPEFKGSCVDRVSPYTPIESPTNNERSSFQNRDEWNLVDSLSLYKTIQAGYHYGVEINSDPNEMMNIITNQPDVNPYVNEALAVVPKWMRNDLEYNLSQMESDDQEYWSQIILNATDPYIDEIAFSIAHLSPAYLTGPYAQSQMIIENAHLIYEIDNDLSFVQVIDYGSSGDEDYYTTTKYLKQNQNRTIEEIEVPRDLYYWNIVFPKISDEIPAYIDPELSENNDTHDENIAPPPNGKFWRSYLYNHNDPGYPKLKYYLQDCEVVNDYSFSMTSAIGAMERWISETMIFGSNAERPHQPVRIFKKHLGRCGEHADLRAALLRLALIPATSILTSSGDHTWNEFWDERWIHWDGGSLDNPMLYENGWGRHYGSIFRIHSNGYLESVSDIYSDEYATIHLYALDSNSNPIDGAIMQLGVMYDGNLRFDNLSYADDEGKCTFLVGEERDYYIKIFTELGDYPGGDDYALVTENIPAGAEQIFSVTIDGAVMPQVNWTEIDIPVDEVDDYKLIVDFQVNNQIIPGPVLMDDVEGGDLFHNQGQGTINFFMSDFINYLTYGGFVPFMAFNTVDHGTEGSFEFNVPMSENWYAIFDNAYSVNNAYQVEGGFSLYRHESLTETGQISGNITNSFDGMPVVGAMVKAGVYQTLTDSNGDYSLEVYPQTYDVVFSACGYLPTVVNELIVENGDNISLNESIDEKALVPNNVTAQELDTWEVVIEWEAPDINITRVKENSRNLVGYSIYRGLVDDDSSVNEWTVIAESIGNLSYVDVNWTGLEDGVYRYAVASVYSGNNESGFATSNDVFNNMLTTIEISVDTNSGDSTEGALVYLVNLDGNPDHEYFLEIPVGGVLTFYELWKGIYDIEITLPGYTFYSNENIEITENYELDVVLEEIIQAVQDLAVFENQLTWEAVVLDRDFQTYNVYIDDMTTPVSSQTENSFDISPYGNGAHIAGISVVYETGVSEIITLEYVNGSSINSQLLSSYNLDNNADDEMGNYNGIIEGDADFITSPINDQAIEFDGDGDYIDCGYIEELNSATAFSFSAWVNIYDWGSWKKFYTKSDKIGVTTGTTEGQLYTFQRNPSDNNKYGYNNTVMRANEWHYVTTTFDGNKPDNSSKLKLYVNGEEIELNYSGNIPDSTIDLAESFTIGYYSDSGLNGAIDDMKIWNRQINPSEIKYLYTQTAPYWGSLEGYVTLDEETPVQSAIVSVGIFETQTDENGFYQLNIPATRYNVSCYSAQYGEIFEENISFNDGETFDLDFNFETINNNDNHSPEYQNNLSFYPNPFNMSNNSRNHSITICYDLAEESNIELDVFNLKGQKVANIEKGFRKSGNYTIIWNGKNDSGNELSSGLYFTRLKYNKKSLYKKLVLIK